MTAEFLDDVIERNDDTARAVFLMFAEQIATTALALAAYRRWEVTESSAGRIIESATGYPGVGMRRVEGLDHDLAYYAKARLISLVHP